MKLHEVKSLINEYGGLTTLSEVFESYNLPYECPQCNGSGVYSKKIIKPYPRGFPDSGWVPDTVEYVRSECTLCSGQGYTKEEYKPKLVQDGWEKS